ncbi:response regulator [Variovorax sp. KK3]|uniref:response regulator n=1 Tax=Variovorax sp. KK3 TaxID=1855728 RepID=UPI0015C34608|nr:response regulator [Variovorax sp. KK3]
MQIDDDPSDFAALPDGEKASILVVDDLPEKLLVFRTVLEELGQDLVLVRSGADALREILQREFAVILLDVNMPGIDGFETATLIRQHRRCAHTPIIFITSYADEMQQARGYSLGAVDYILSPVVPEILRGKVSVFVSLYLMQRQVRRQADARAAVAAAQTARRAAEENDRRSAFLADASRALGGSLQIEIAMEQLAALLVPRLAPLALVLASDPELGAGALRAAAQAADEAWPRLVAASDAALPDGVRAALREASEGRRHVRIDAPALAQLAGALLGPSKPVALGAGMVVPLTSGERTLGAVLVAGPAEGDGPDLGLVDELAARAGAAFENARLYRSLQAAQEELQRANRRKDEFLAMMSHELRNPLAPIHTAVEVIRRVGTPHPKVDWALDIAERQLRQLTRLIEELLDVARISQGKIVLKRQTLDLRSVITQSVETVQPFIDGRRQHLAVTLPREPAWVAGDTARLTQVIANLLHNAAKYSPDDTDIALACAVDQGEVVVSVRDQGMGIDAALLPRIFDLFEQGERGLDRMQGGLGVGLTLARRLTEMHGGRIEAHSEGHNHGSEFRLWLPCTAGPALAPAPAAAAAAAALRADALRVLVVDDNQDAAAGIAAVLELEGHVVRIAADGQQALAALAAHQPEAVVLDIGLPLLDGYEVARRMRAMPEGKALLLIALTGYGQREDRKTAFKAGFDHHFVKPADAQGLLACIRQWSVGRAGHNGNINSSNNGAENAAA